MLTYFEIIYYSIRLYFIKQIGVSANEERAVVRRTLS